MTYRLPLLSIAAVALLGGVGLIRAADESAPAPTKNTPPAADTVDAAEKAKADAAAKAKAKADAKAAAAKAKAAAIAKAKADEAARLKAEADADAKLPHGIETRTPWTTSKVVGAPDPPPPYRAKRIYPNLDVHLAMAIEQEPGSKRLWIADLVQEKDKLSRIFVIDDSQDATTGDVVYETDWGIYSMMIHPDFEKNHYIYVEAHGIDRKPSMPGEKRDNHMRVTRYTVIPGTPPKVDMDSAFIILDWESPGHSGGEIGFGPDGMLYIPTGDGSGGSDKFDSAQDLSDIRGKVLRIDVDHPDPGKPYSIPQDNPFVDTPGARPEIWALGLRNPWRMSFDREGNLWVGNNGQDLWEQVYLIERGANYGWAVLEGSHPFQLERKRGPEPFSKPVLDHSHNESRSLTGGLVYYGKKFPELYGTYIYGDYMTGKIWGAKYDKAKKEITWHGELADTSIKIIGFSTDTEGELIIQDHLAALYTFQPNPPDTSLPPFPRKLSETGVYASTKDKAIDPGLIPYSVNSPLWSDGAIKDRWLGLVGDGKIDTSRGWVYPEGTVFVKEFALELEEGTPESRQRIETRLLTMQQGEWVGYSYAWNEAQDDAELVETLGLDIDYTIKTADGSERSQKWHIPSRAECKVCHSQSGGFVLGFNQRQLDKLHDYGKMADNQMRTLNHLQVFDKQLPKLPARLAPLVDPYDTTQDLTARARSYLHVNCANCHMEDGGGNSLMTLHAHYAEDKMKIVDVVPQHANLGIEDARIVAAGDPDRSVLLKRMSIRGPGQMPPLATNLVDERAVALIREWIQSVKKPEPPPETAGK